MASRGGNRWGHPRGYRTANPRSITGGFRVGFPLGTPRLRSRMRKTDDRRRKREKKKAGECTHEQRESYEFAKEEERKASDGRRKKEEERRVCIASRLPLYPGWQRGEGERQKEGHNMPYERAPWTSHCGLAKERRAGRKVRRRRRNREKERERAREEGGGNSLDKPRVDVKERDRLGERARPLNLEQSGRAISARTRRPVSIVVGFCDRAADGQPPEARQIRATAPRFSRRRDRRRKVKRGRERDRTHSRRLSADRAARSRPVEARGSQQRKTKEGAKPVEDRSRRRSRPRTPCSLTPCISRVQPVTHTRSAIRSTSCPGSSQELHPSSHPRIYHRTPSDPTQTDLTRAIFPIIAGTTYLFLPAPHRRQPLCDRRDLRRNPAVSCPNHFPPGPRRPRVYDEVSTRGIGYASPRARAPNCRFRRA